MLSDATACKDCTEVLVSEIFREEVHGRAKRRQLELKMVAGMVMPLADLRAIYELLFRDAVIVAKKDKHPQSMHPDLQGISNLKVIHAMASLKSKGCVKETFVWKHAYYYITNEGVAYLRNYLHLPPEILPASLQRVSRPASSARVRTPKGRSPHVPKPKRVQESEEAVTERCIYRHRRAEAGGRSERPPSTFRAFESVGQPGVQTPTFFKRDENVCRGHEPLAKRDNWKSSVKGVQLPVSLVPSTSVNWPTTTVQTALCASAKGVQQKRAKQTAVNPPGEGSKVALEVASEAEAGGHVLADQRTVPLLAALVEKEEQDVEVVTEETPEISPGDKDMTTTVKAVSRTQTSETPFLKTTPLQEDQISPAEDPEKGQGVQRAWHDVLEGLSSS